MSRRKIVHLLIGGGIASATCAAELRDRGATGSIAVLGRELDAPYHRPPVTKGYLQGKESRDDTLIHPASWWEENDVELMTRTSVMAIDLEARVATLSTKEEIEFGQALLATGALIRRLNVDGSDLQRIHYLRALGNADSLRRDIEQAEQVVMIGGSYIGCETAASLTDLGKKCTIVMLEAHPLERGFGATAGRFFRRILEERGVAIVGEDELERYEGADGVVSAVVTKGGRELPAQAVVVGVGAMPDVMLAKKVGLEIGESGGVRCDACLRTSAPGVFAAGDMAEYDSVIHGRRLRIEHEDVAAEHGRTVARAMLGDDQPHRVVPYFFSDLSDWASLEYIGPAPGWDEEVVRGSVDDGRFSIWYLCDGRVAGVLAVGDSAPLDAGRKLLEAGTPVTAAQLADGVDLGGLLEASTAS